MTEPKYGDGLTRKQRKIFDFVEMFQREHGYAPTRAEISKEIGIHSGTVHGHLRRLDELKALRRSPNSNAFEINQQFSKGVYVKVVNA